MHITYSAYDPLLFVCLLFFFNDTATTEIYTLSLHDALPICAWAVATGSSTPCPTAAVSRSSASSASSKRHRGRSEEHTSELQSRVDLVCRLLLEKKKKKISVSTVWGRELGKGGGR